MKFKLRLLQARKQNLMCFFVFCLLLFLSFFPRSLAVLSLSLSGKSTQATTNELLLQKKKGGGGVDNKVYHCVLNISFIETMKAPLMHNSSNSTHPHVDISGLAIDTEHKISPVNTTPVLFIHSHCDTHLDL